MIRFFLTIPLSLLVQIGHAQSPESVRTFYALSNMATGNAGTFNVMSSKPTEIVGNYYYNGDKNFKEGLISVEGFEKPFGYYKMRYNLKTNELEAILKEGLRSLSLNKINSFLLRDSVNKETLFLKAQHYEMHGTKIVGFLEVISEGKISLLKRKNLRMQSSPFNPLLVEESANVQILQDEELFILKENHLVKIDKKNKKEFMALFENDTVASRYFTSTKINFKKEADLILFIRHYNSQK